MLAPLNRFKPLIKFVKAKGMLEMLGSVEPIIPSIRARISLAMIVRNNEAMIGAAIRSAAPWVDEIVIVDTGSSDRTKSICKSLGARVYDFEWCDDFSAARNESLRYCTGDWIFWMDSDDVLPPSQGAKLRKLLSEAPSKNFRAFVLQVYCSSGSSGQSTIVDHVKVFPNLREISFEFRIHEQVLPSIRRAGGDVVFTDIHVVHIGTVHSPETRDRKLDRDLRILALEQRENPNHPFTLFNLGMTYDDAGRFEEAVIALRECIHLSCSQDSHLRKAWAILSNSLRCLGKFDQAINAINAGLEVFPIDRASLSSRGAPSDTGTF